MQVSPYLHALEGSYPNQSLGTDPHSISWQAAILDSNIRIRAADNRRRCRRDRASHLNPSAGCQLVSLTDLRPNIETQQRLASDLRQQGCWALRPPPAVMVEAESRARWEHARRAVCEEARRGLAPNQHDGNPSPRPIRISSSGGAPWRPARWQRAFFELVTCCDKHPSLQLQLRPAGMES